MSLEFITSKTHYYIKVILRPSKYLYDNNQKVYQAKAALESRKHTLFLEKLIEFVIYKRMEDLFVKYNFKAYDCAIEEMHEMSGLFIATVGKGNIYCIPKDRKDIFDFIRHNCENKIKILKRTQGSFMKQEPSRLYRDLATKRNIDDEETD